MEAAIHTFIVSNVTVFVLIFARLGSGVMLIPGVGDSFVSSRVRLLFALAFSVILTPVLADKIPAVSFGSFDFLLMVVKEAVIGIFIGTIARIFMTALDTGGMLISMQTGLGNAMVFNPSMAGQGSIIGAMLSVTGSVLVFATDLHHVILYALFMSYDSFPAGIGIPMAEDMGHSVARAVADSFAIGFFMATPFFVVSLLLYIGMGVLGRLMPQIQVFILALPLQILLGMMTLFITLSVGLLFWLGRFSESIQAFFIGIG